MNRAWMGAVVVLAAAMPAAATERFVDNRLIASGTATGGSGLNQIDLGSPAYGSGFGSSDLQYSGLIIMSGTGAPTSSTHYKITAMAGSVATVSPNFPATATSNWVYRVHYGSDVNGGNYANQTKGSGVGPALNIQTCHDACASGDRINIKTSSRWYSEEYTANKWLNLWKNAVLTIQSFENTPGDLDESALTSTIPSDGIVTQTASQKRTKRSLYAVIAPQYAGGSAIFLQGMNTYTFRNLKFVEYAAQSQIIWIISGQGSYAPTFDQCDIGQGSAIAGQIGVLDASSAGQRFKVTFTKCSFNTKGGAIKMVYNDQLACYDCDFERPSPSASYPTIDIQVPAAATAAYDATAGDFYTSNQLRRAIVDACWFNESGTEATFCYPIAVYSTTSATGPRLQEFIRITRSRVYTKRSSCVYLTGIPSFEIGYCRLLTDSPNGAGDLINLSPDASWSTGLTTGRVILARALVSSATSPGSGNGSIVLASDPLNAVDNAYRGCYATVIRKDAGGESNTRPIYSWTDSTNTIVYQANTGAGTDNPAISPTPVAGDIVEIWQQRPYGRMIHHCQGQMLQGNVSEGHLVLIGQGWDNVDLIENTFLGTNISNNGLVLKGRRPVIIGNKVRAGRGVFLPKGGVEGVAYGNTFVCWSPNGGGAAVDWEDKSTYQVSGATAILFNELSERGFGWWNTNNIFAVIGTNCPALLDNQADVGTWAKPSSLDPLAQFNYFDHNLFWRDDNADGVSDVDASHPIAQVDGANVTDLAALRAKWLDTSYQTAFRALDVNSQYGAPLFTDLTNGDLSLKPLSAARLKASVPGMNIGAWQTYSRAATPGVNR